MNEPPKTGFLSADWRWPALAVQVITGYLLFFAVRSLIGIEPNTPFELSAILVFAVSVIALLTGRHMLFFYANMFLFVYMFAHFLQFSLGAGYMTRQHLKSDFTWLVFAVIAAHFVFLTAGFMLAPARRTAGTNAPFAVQRSKFVFGTGVILALIVAAIGYFGWDFLVSSRVETQSTFSNRPGYEVFSLYAVKALPYFLLWAVLDYIRVRGAGFSVLAFAAAVAVFALLFSNPSNTPRFICLSAMAMIAIYAVIRSGVIPMTMAIAASPFALLIALPLTSIMRRPDYELSFPAWARSFNTLEFSAVQLLADGIDQVHDVACCTNKVLSAILVLFPRSLWPAKSTGTGVGIAEANFYVSTNVAVPSFYDFYADYGFAGIAVLSLIAGYLLGRTRLPVRATALSFYDRQVAYPVIVFALVPILVRGDLSTFCVCLYAFAIAYEGVRAITSGRVFSRQSAAMESIPASPSRNRSSG